MVDERKETIAFMETVLYLIERPAIYCMFTTNVTSYYILSVIVAILATAARMALKPEFLEAQDIDKLVEKLGWVFCLERIGILLFQFYAASGSLFCACIAYLILLFTTLFALIDWIDWKPVELLQKPEEGKHKPVQDSEARQEADTAPQQEQAGACSDNNEARNETVSRDSSRSSDCSDESWEVLDSKASEDSPDPTSPKPSNQACIKSVSEAEEEGSSSHDPVYFKPIEPSRDDMMSPLEDCCPSLGFDQDQIRSNIDAEEEALSNCKPTEPTGDDTVTSLEDCRPSLESQDFPVSEQHPEVSEKLNSEICELISNSKRQMISLLMEGKWRHRDVAVDRMQVKEVIEYLLERLLEADREAKLYKACLLNDKRIEQEEEDEKKKEEEEKEERELSEEWNEWEEQWTKLLVERDTLKASEAELEQNAITLEHQLKFLRRYYQDSVNYYMSNPNLHQPPCLNSNVLHLEHNLKELRDKIAFLKEELEYEQRFSEYYRQQCGEYSTDKKYMNQAYQDLEEKCAEERHLKDRLGEKLNRALEREKELKTQNEALKEAFRKIAFSFASGNYKKD